VFASRIIDVFANIQYYCCLL